MSDDARSKGQQSSKDGHKKLNEAVGSKKVEKRSPAGFALDGGDIRKPKPTVQSKDDDDK